MAHGASLLLDRLTWGGGGKKRDFILVGFILVKLWQKAEDDKGGFKAFNPLSTLSAFNLHGHYT